MTVDPELFDALHAPALDFIRRIRALHEAGRGQLSLLDTLASFGISPSAEAATEIQTRDIWNFTSSSAAEGTFFNQGRRTHFVQNGVHASFPEVIQGNYALTAVGVSLDFEKGHAPEGLIVLLSSRLEFLAIDDNTIRVRLSDDVLDVILRHGIQS